MSRTRNQRKREIIEHICFSLVFLVLCFALALWLTLTACKAWNHPAEQPITYSEHIERFGGADNAIQN